MVDYILKIKQHLNSDVVKAEEINEFINFMNRCFRERNNFMIPNFNLSNLKLCLSAYNKMKSNILSSKSDIQVFTGLTDQELKVLVFILFNIQSKYEELGKPDISYTAVKNVSIYLKTFRTNK